MHEDFERYGAAVGLSTVCVYGGAPMANQEYALRRGVDVVVGTPGRVKDFVERGSLNMTKLRFRVLDEADEMLNMGAPAGAAARLPRQSSRWAVRRQCRSADALAAQALWRTWS